MGFDGIRLADFELQSHHWMIGTTIITEIPYCKIEDFIITIKEKVIYIRLKWILMLNNNLFFFREHFTTLFLKMMYINNTEFLTVLRLSASLLN